MPVIEARYAQALLSCASSSEQADEIGTVLQDFYSSTSGKEVREFLLSPVISANIRKQTVKKLLPQDAPVTVLNFLCLLIDKGRLVFLPGIMLEYQSQKGKMCGSLDVIVYSAQALTKQQLDSFANKYKAKYAAASIDIKNEIDPTLIGGICVKVGDMRIDDTIQSRIRGLQQYILSNV